MKRLVISPRAHRLMRLCAYSIIAWTLATSAIHAANSDLDAIADRIDLQTNTADLEGLRATCEAIDAHPAATTRDGQHASALCQYRLGTSLMGTGGDDAGMAFAQAQETLEAMLADLPDEDDLAPELMSLLSGVMGVRIGLEPSLSMSLGMRSGRLISKALRLAPDNPRVQLQEGISKLNTPKMWGGSVRRGEEALRKAVAIFAERRSTAAGSGWRNWGDLDALAWLGQALARQEKTDDARAAYQQALALQPEMAWVKYQLLPALDG